MLALMVALTGLAVIFRPAHWTLSPTSCCARRTPARREVEEQISVLSEARDREMAAAGDDDDECGGYTGERAAAPNGGSAAGRGSERV